MEKFILLKALTNSEWDHVDFALLPIETIETHLKKKQILASLNGEVDELVIYEDAVVFYASIEDLPERFTSEDYYKEKPMLVELSDQEIEALSKPDQTIKSGQVKFSKEEVTFTGHGKHTNEEYWCSLHWEHVSEFQNIGSPPLSQEK